jgi:predicted GNAT superfamily acetyltransferase
MEKVEIRNLKTHAEYGYCVDIQREVWRHEDIDLTPIHQFSVSVRTGGILLGAFLGKKMAGFVYSFPALFGKKNCQHSHLLAVLPEYRGLGIGKMLKWAQRHAALKGGYDLVTWTFDPLQARNANLNIHTLGAVARTYLPNFYGFTPALILGPKIPTDRFFLEWWIKTEAVEMRRRRKQARLRWEELPRVLERTTGSGENPDVLSPGRPCLSADDSILLVEVPGNIHDLSPVPALIAGWQRAIRNTMFHYFSRGYRIEDFVFSERSFYVLKKERRKA